jgi:hypothetical protein
MALEKEIWIKDIDDTLFEGAEFIDKSVNHSSFIDNKTVHVPQSGAAPGVAINRATLPATISQRTDTELTYNVDEYTTDPILVRNLDELQISYDKRQSVMGQHIELLRERIGTQTLFNWGQDATLAANRVVTTSGTASNFALAPSATGTRKGITTEDVSKLAAIFDQDLVPMADRYIEMPVYMYYQLINEDQVLDASRRGQATIEKGVVNELYGFKIMIRPTVNVYDNSTIIKAVGAAAAATDNLGALAWQKNSVAAAKGAIDMMSDFGDNGNGKPEYYGGLLSATVMHGAKNLRSDLKGVAAIVQAV